MNADEMRKAAAFMEFDVKKSEQKPIAGEYLSEYSGRMNKDRTVITFLGPFALAVFEGGDSEMDYTLYNDKGEYRRGDQKPIIDSENTQRVVVDRSVLMKLLEPMTSDFVMLKVADDYPVKVCGEIGESKAAAYIAPRIDE